MPFDMKAYAKAAFGDSYVSPLSTPIDEDEDEKKKEAAPKPAPTILPSSVIPPLEAPSAFGQQTQRVLSEVPEAERNEKITPAVRREPGYKHPERYAQAAASAVAGALTGGKPEIFQQPDESTRLLNELLGESMTPTEAERIANLPPADDSIALMAASEEEFKKAHTRGAPQPRMDVRPTAKPSHWALNMAGNFLRIAPEFAASIMKTSGALMWHAEDFVFGADHKVTDNTIYKFGVKADQWVKKNFDGDYQLATDFVSNELTRGASTAALALGTGLMYGPVAGISTFGPLAFADQYDTALNSGKSPEEALLSALVRTGTELGTEFAGGLEFRILKGLNNRTGGMLGRIVSASKGFTREAVQEATQQVLQNANDIALLRREIGLLDNVPESALLGGILGGMMDFISANPLPPEVQPLPVESAPTPMDASPVSPEQMAALRTDEGVAAIIDNISVSDGARSDFESLRSVIPESKAWSKEQRQGFIEQARAMDRTADELPDVVRGQILLKQYMEGMGVEEGTDRIAIDTAAHDDRVMRERIQAKGESPTAFVEDQLPDEKAKREYEELREIVSTQAGTPVYRETPDGPWLRAIDGKPVQNRTVRRAFDPEHSRHAKIHALGLLSEELERPPVPQDPLVAPSAPQGPQPPSNVALDRAAWGEGARVVAPSDPVQRQAAAAGDALKMDVILVQSQPGKGRAYGQADKNDPRRIYLDADIVKLRGPQAAMAGYFAHELMHQKRKTRPKDWQALYDLVEKNDRVGLMAAADAYQEDRAGAGFDRLAPDTTALRNEALSRYMEDHAFQTGWWEKVAANELSLFRRIIGHIKRMYARVRSPLYRKMLDMLTSIDARIVQAEQAEMAPKPSPEALRQAAAGDFVYIEPQAFLDQFDNNSGGGTLSQYTAEELAKPEYHLFKLRDFDVYYMLHDKGDGEFYAGGLMGNDPAARGAAVPAALLHMVDAARRMGGTKLTADAFDVNGFLPNKYKAFGMQEVWRVDFDEAYWEGGKEALDRARAYWKKSGWDGPGDPQVVGFEMPLEGTENNRDNYLRTGSITGTPPAAPDSFTKAYRELTPKDLEYAPKPHKRFGTSSIDYRNGDKFLDIERKPNKKAAHGERATVGQIAVAFEDWARSKGHEFSVKDYGDYPKTARAKAQWNKKVFKKIRDSVAEELEHAILNDPDALGWYDRRIALAMEAMSVLHPELWSGSPDYSPAHESLFKLIVAITSNGSGVGDNFRMSEMIYSEWKTSQRLPTVNKNFVDHDGDVRIVSEKSRPKKGNHPVITAAEEGGALWGHARGWNVRKHLILIQTLLDNPNVGLGRLREWMTEMDTIKNHKRDLGLPSFANGEATWQTVPRAFMFGPKLGAFFMNGHGYHNFLTMDVWWTRMFRRHTGHLKTWDAKLNKGKGGWTSVGAPKGVGERLFMRAVLNDILRKPSPALVKLQQMTGERLTVADAQAALWYYEKRLWEEQGYVGPFSETIDYAHAARDVVTANKKRVSQDLDARIGERPSSRGSGQLGARTAGELVRDSTGKTPEVGDLAPKPENDPRRVGQRANIGTTPAVREFLDFYERARLRLGEPKPKAVAAVQAEALQRLQKDYAGEKRRLLDAGNTVGGMLSDVETVIAQSIINVEGADALASGNVQKIGELARLVHAYRWTGTEQARSFRLRVDPQESPAQRIQRLVTEAVTLPPPHIADAIENAIKGDRIDKADQLRDEWARTVRRIMDDLKGRGFDMETIRNLGDNPKAAGRLLRRIKSMRPGSLPDMLFEYWRNSILSATTTQMANMTGNLAHSMAHFAVYRPLEALVGSVMPNAGGATLRELSHMYAGLYRGLGHAWRNAMLAWDTETAAFERELGYGGHSRIEMPDTHIPSKQFRIRGKEFEVGGRQVRIPQRALLAADEFAKTAIAHAEVGARAYRIARMEGKRGEAASNRMVELMLDTSSRAWKESLGVALELTFQKTLSYDDVGIEKMVHQLSDGLIGLRRKAPILQWIIPFITTPSNIFITGVRKSPLGLGHLLMNVARGRWDLVPRSVAEQLVATAVTWLLWSHFKDDDTPRITGASPYWDSKTNARPPAQSLRLGDTWYSYARIEPFATALSIMVDTVDAMIKKDSKRITDMPAHVAKQFAEKTFMRGIGDIITAMTVDENREDSWKKEAARYIGNFATSWIPNLARQIARETSDTYSERRVLADGEAWGHEFLMRSLQRGEVFRAWLPDNPKINQWGQPIERSRSPIPGTDLLWRMIVPIETRPALQKGAEYDRLITNWNSQPGSATWEPQYPKGWWESKGKKDWMTRGEYEQYLRAAGETALNTLYRTIPNPNAIEEVSQRDIDKIKKAFEIGRAKAKAEVLRNRNAEKKKQKAGGTNTWASFSKR